MVHDRIDLLMMHIKQILCHDEDLVLAHQRLKAFHKYAADDFLKKHEDLVSSGELCYMRLDWTTNKETRVPYVEQATTSFMKMPQHVSTSSMSLVAQLCKGLLLLSVSKSFTTEQNTSHYA